MQFSGARDLHRPKTYVDLAMEKSAKGGKLLSSMHGLVRHGLWGTLGRTARDDHKGLRAVGNKVSRLFYNPTGGSAGKGADTMLSHAMNFYGMGGLGAGMLGYSVPGSELAFNIVAPGMGAMFSAPGAITTARMASTKNQDRLREDVMSGARTAAADLISLADRDPNVVKQRGTYRRYLQQVSPELGRIRKAYQGGGPEAMSLWDTAGAALMDPQKIINNRVDRGIDQMLHKSGGIGGAAKAVFPWLFPALGVGAIGAAVTRDKPYDEEQARLRGYAGASTKLENELDNMSGIQRFFAGMDPSLVAGRIEKALPGTLDHLEASTGQPYQFGLLGGWSRPKGSSPPKPPKYYQYDAAGQTHYL